MVVQVCENRTAKKKEEEEEATSPDVNVMSKIKALLIFGVWSCEHGTVHLTNEKTSLMACIRVLDKAVSFDGLTSSVFPSFLHFVRLPLFYHALFSAAI